VVDMEAATMAIHHEMTVALHAKEAAATEIAIASAMEETASDHTKAATTNHDKEEDTENQPGFVAWWYTPFSLGNMYHSFITLHDDGKHQLQVKLGRSAGLTRKHV